MPQQRVRLVASFVAVLALVLALIWYFHRSDVPGHVGAGDDRPRHGGTLVFLTERSREEPPGWDVEEAAGASAMLYVNPYEEYLLGADVLAHGPRGSNEFPFSMAEEEVPEKYLKGVLAESWEVTTRPLGVTFHIRHGVMWTGNPHIGMKPREFTAADAAFVLNRYRSGKQSNKISQFTAPGAFRAIDRYTLRAEFTRYNASWAWVIGYALYSPMYPPETVKAGPKDWQNAVGTGPFRLDSYVQGSYVSYRKNPGWWNREQVVAGRKYQTPFIDELVFPIVTSLATQLAAIRTGQVDIATSVASVNKETLQSLPVSLRETPSGRAMRLVFNAAKGPARSLAFRRAVAIGLDNQAVINAVLPGGSVGGAPFSRHLGESVFTPIDKLPADVASLYGHDPAKARALLKQAGFAGVELPIYYATADGRGAQAGALIADQLSKIGIRPVLLPVEAAVLSKYQTGDPNWEGALVWFGSDSKVGRGIDNLRYMAYMSYHSDKGHNERMDRIMAMTSDAERNVALKREAAYMIGQAGEIGIGEEPVLTVWWPWVRNYHGEVEAGFNNYNPMFSTLWINADRKRSMGY